MIFTTVLYWTGLYCMIYSNVKVVNFVYTTVDVRNVYTTVDVRNRISIYCN